MGVVNEKWGRPRANATDPGDGGLLPQLRRGSHATRLGLRAHAAKLGLLASIKGGRDGT
jgi:hypothetical protein